MRLSSEPALATVSIPLPGNRGPWVIEMPVGFLLLLLVLVVAVIGVATMATISYRTTMQRVREYSRLVVEMESLREQNAALGELEGELRRLIEYQEQMLLLAGIRPGMGLEAGPDHPDEATEQGLVLRWPVEGDIVTIFKKSHPGVDIGIGRRRAVVAAANGIVVAADRDPVLGPRLVIAHNDSVQTLYANNELILAAVGDTVEAGQAIALVGSGFEGKAPHLHFEVHEYGQPVDPRDYIPDLFEY